ncbi:MAG: hypothetical protein WC593_15125 [Methanoregula sp.]
MARPCKIPEDPEVLDRILENMALGLSSRLIAESLGENENTVKGWKNRKDFNQKLAIKKLEILGAPLRGMADRFPKDFIERHPETREAFAPPTQKKELSGPDGKPLSVKLNVIFVDPVDPENDV